MRTIKFRGKDKNGQWRYGLIDTDRLSDGKTIYAIYKSPIPADLNEESYYYWEVDENTIGQYTGFVDANGKEIYEGDIVKLKSSKAVVTWMTNKACFYLSGYDAPMYEQRFANNILLGVVIGNIYDNKEELQ
jgi:uncharacterized phage protein (TIGR01671 family)